MQMSYPNIENLFLRNNYDNRRNRRSAPLSNVELDYTKIRITGEQGIS